MKNIFLLTSQTGRTAAFIAQRIKSQFNCDITLISSKSKCAQDVDTDIFDYTIFSPAIKHNGAINTKSVDYFKHVLYGYNEGDIVVLVGWKYIVPQRITEVYNIFNIHPADVVKFPHMKGIDPQERVICEVLKSISTHNDSDYISHRHLGLIDIGCGATFHKVDGGVDTGEPLIHRHEVNTIRVPLHLLTHCVNTHEIRELVYKQHDNICRNVLLTGILELLGEVPTE